MRLLIGKIQLRILGILLLIIAIFIVALIRNAELPTFIIGGLLALATLFVALLRWVNPVSYTHLTLPTSDLV